MCIGTVRHVDLQVPFLQRLHIMIAMPLPGTRSRKDHGFSHYVYWINYWSNNHAMNRGMFDREFQLSRSSSLWFIFILLCAPNNCNKKNMRRYVARRGCIDNVKMTTVSAPDSSDAGTLGVGPQRIRRPTTNIQQRKSLLRILRRHLATGITYLYFQFASFRQSFSPEPPFS